MPDAILNPRTHRFSVDPIVSGTFQNLAHSLTQVNLDVGDASADHFYNGWAVIVVKTGVAAGDVRFAETFLTATNILTVKRPFRAVPGADTYDIYTAISSDYVIGTARAGDANSITLALKEGIRDAFWEGCKIDLVGGAGGNTNQPMQGRDIINFVGATGVALLNRPLSPVADATTIYRLYGHLYHPCRNLSVFEDASAPMFFGNKPGAISFGSRQELLKYGGGLAEPNESYLEMAMKAGSATVNVKRWE